MSEHRKLTEHDDDTGEPYDVCPACAVDWPCVYGKLAAAETEVVRLRGIVREAWRFWAAVTGGFPLLEGLPQFSVTRRVWEPFDEMFRPQSQRAEATRPAGEGESVT